MRESSNWQSKWSRREPFGENIGENISHMITTGNKLDSDISSTELDHEQNANQPLNA